MIRAKGPAKGRARKPDPLRRLKAMARRMRLAGDHGRPYDPQDLAAIEAGIRAMEAVRESMDILYPPKNPDEEWQVETIEYVASEIAKGDWR